MSDNPKQPDRKIIRQILDDVEAVTKGRFYEDPAPPQGPVEMFLVRDGRAGEAFNALPLTQKVQVLSDYAELERYEAAGITYRQINQIVWNVIEGKPRSQWLDETGLVERGGKISLDRLKEMATEQRKQPGHRKGRDKGMER